MKLQRNKFENRVVEFTCNSKASFNPFEPGAAVHESISVLKFDMNEASGTKTIPFSCLN